MKISIKPGASLTNSEAARFDAGLAAEMSDPRYAALASRTVSLSPDQAITSADTKIVTDFVHQIGIRSIDNLTQQAEAVAGAAADDAMSKFFPWVASVFFLIGPLGPQGRAVLNEAGVTWKPLSQRYLTEKEHLNLSSGYWRFTGALYRQFTASNTRRKGIFGQTRFTSSQNAGFKATINIDVAPDIIGASGQGFEEELVDLGFGGNELMVRKLQGRLSYYRPLLGPALNYFIKNIVQGVVVQKLTDAGFKMKRIRASTSDVDFSSFEE